MILTERHIIDFEHKYYKDIDKLTFLSKNLYNHANYIVRQEFIKTTKLKEEGKLEHANWIRYYDLRRILINHEDYIALPRKVSNQILMLVEKNWKSFFESIKDYKINPNKYKGRPKLPKYKDKTNGRFIVPYEKASISKKEIKNNIIKLSGIEIKLPFINKNCKLNMVRIVPKNNKTFVIEIIYEKEEENLNLNKNNILGIDLGVNNLCTLTSNKKGFKPIIINGRPLKSYNQYYNKKKSELQSKINQESKKSRKINRLSNKRDNKIDFYLHNVSKRIINICIENNIGTIVVGKNDEWKQDVNIGKVNNQNFVMIPFNRLIEKLEYKSKLKMIDFLSINESYTSKCSFLDDEEIKKHGEYKGKRIKRGLFKTKNNLIINSDVNGSYNILKKAFPNAFADGIEGLAVVPIKINI